ncbi:MAG TPA: hypothetical protein DIW31_11980 [Bacteroidales bacterium]|nr:hypothetical protein [Bacteroidales bacterium]
MINYAESINITTLSVNDITDVSANASFTCNKDGEVYYAVLNANATIPTANEIRTGVAGAVTSDHKTVEKDVSATAAINGLTASTAYTLYAVLVDDQSNASEVTSKNFTTLATGINVTDRDVIKIYPNPVTTWLQISMNKADGKGNFSLYSISGSKLSEGRIENGNALLNMEEYPSGIYILRITDGAFVQEYKVIKK